MLQCKCGKNILVNLNNKYLIRGLPVISKGNISISTVLFSIENNDPQFVCPSCGNINPEDIKFMCKECGKYYNYKDLRVSSYGSTVCNHCIAKYEFEDTSEFAPKFRME